MQFLPCGSLKFSWGDKTYAETIENNIKLHMRNRLYKYLKTKVYQERMN